MKELTGKEKKKEKRDTLLILKVGTLWKLLNINGRKYKLNGCQSKEREQKHNTNVVQLFFFFWRNLYDLRGSILTAYINDIKQ